MSDDTIRNLYILAVIGLACWAWFRHPFPLLIGFVAFSLALGEFYPFSNFPMYSDPDDRENYFVLAAIPSPEEAAKLPPPSPSGTAPAETLYYKFGDTICKPLPSSPFTQLTAPTIKKMFKSRLDKYAKQRDTKRKHLNPEQREEVGKELLIYIRQHAAKSTAPKRDELPDDLALLEFWIEPDTEKGGFIETPGLVASENKANDTRSPQNKAKTQAQDNAEAVPEATPDNESESKANTTVPVQ